MATWTKRYSGSHNYVNMVVTATESDVNIADNTSKVTVVVQLKSSSTTRVWNGDSQSLTVSIDGTQAGSRTFTYNIYNAGTVTLGTYSRVVTHNSDGSKSASISVSASGGGDSASFSESLTLTNIARASIPTVSASSVAIGSKVTVNFNRKSTSFRHKLTYAFAGTSGTLVSTGSNVASYAWTLPNSLADAIPSKTSNGLTFTLKTYNGSTEVGSHNISITVTVPNNSTFNPSITTPTRTELTSAINTYMSGTIINGRSRIRFSSTATTRYSASVSNIQIRFTHSGGGTWTYNVSGSGNTRTYDWNANNTSGTWTVVMIVTDSRGRTATSSGTSFSVTAYTAPKLTVATANRDATTSTTLRLNVTATNSSISGKNQMTFKVYTKPRSSSTWSASKHTVTSTNGTISLSNHAITSYSETESYDVQFEVYDRLTNSIYAEVTVGTTKVLFDAYKDDGIAIGGMYSTGTGGALQVHGQTSFHSLAKHYGGTDFHGKIYIDNNTAIYGKDTGAVDRRLILKGSDNHMHLNPDNHGNIHIHSNVYSMGNNYLGGYGSEWHQLWVKGHASTPNATNPGVGASINIKGSNNIMEIGMGQATNDRNGFIQTRHSETAYANAYGQLKLNPRGGSVYVGGQFDVAGSKNAIHVTRDGVRATPAYETAESYLGDIGSGNTGSNSMIVVPIETLFNDIVNTEIEYQVFLQAYGNGRVWVEERNEDHFVVKSDVPNIEFGWELKAKRRGYENDRLKLNENLSFQDIQNSEGLSGGYATRSLEVEK